MTEIYIISEDQELKGICRQMLSAKFTVTALTENSSADYTNDCKASALNILDADYIDKTISSYDEIRKLGEKILILGSHWPEEKQVSALVAGASGYCEKSVTSKILIKAIDSILDGDIWIQRRFILQVIEKLAQNRQDSSSSKPQQATSEEKLNGLSEREVDVIKMVCMGQNNKTIANSLNISERTVKFHLTSIYKKLDVQDRLKLAIMFKGSNFRQIEPI